MRRRARPHRASGAAPDHRAAVAATALLLAVALACIPSRRTTPADLPGARRAALARLIVDNRTGIPLTIAFLYAAETGPGGEIGVGTADPGALTELAPIPAAEPIVLIARGPAGEVRLAPRSLEIDEVWTWVITEQPGTGGG